MAAAASFPEGADELAYAGGLLRKPVELLNCQSIPLEAPADCEIVLEGEIVPGCRVSDGPFLDYAGVANTNPYARKFEVTGIRLSPGNIFRGAAIGLAALRTMFVLGAGGAGPDELSWETTEKCSAIGLVPQKMVHLTAMVRSYGMIKILLKGMDENNRSRHYRRIRSSVRSTVPDIDKDIADVHCVVSDAGWQVVADETGLDRAAVSKLATHLYDNDDLHTPIASGSFGADGMVVLPCSIKSLSAIVNCYSDTLLIRAADVTAQAAPAAYSRSAGNAAPRWASFSHAASHHNERS